MFGVGRERENKTPTCLIVRCYVGREKTGEKKKTVFSSV